MKENLKLLKKKNISEEQGKEIEKFYQLIEIILKVNILLMLPRDPRIIYKIVVKEGVDEKNEKILRRLPDSAFKRIIQIIHSFNINKISGEKSRWKLQMG
jgi:hypothetical protein